MKDNTSLLIVLAAASLTACGGGGGSGLAPECLFCGPEAPITFTVDAGEDTTVAPGETVDLIVRADHSRSHLVFEWTQIAGPAVDIASAKFPHASFVAPSTNDFVTLSFRVTATTTSTAIPEESKSDKVNVTVAPCVDSGVEVENPSAIATDTANLRLLVADLTHCGIFTYDLTNGQSTYLSNLDARNDATPLRLPHRISVNSSGTTAWVLDLGHDNIVSIDLANGARELLIDTIGSDLQVSFSDATDLILDEINSQLFLVFGHDASTPIVSISLATGARTVLSDATIPTGNVPFGHPTTLALDSVGNRLLVLQRNLPSQNLSDNVLLEIDPTTGQRVVIFDSSIITGVPFDAYDDILNSRVLISWQDENLGDHGDGLGQTYSILSLDLASDQLERLFVLPDDFFANKITLDPLNSRLLVLSQGNIYAIDMDTGQVSSF